LCQYAADLEVPLLQPPDQFERLVGRDAAADDQGNARLYRGRAKSSGYWRGHGDGGERDTAERGFAQDHPHLVFDGAAVARGAQPQLVADGIVEFSDGETGHGAISSRYASNASISRRHCNHICLTASRIPIKVAAMIQSATVRQRLLRPSARLIAAMVSGDSVRPSRVMFS